MRTILYSILIKDREMKKILEGNKVTGKELKETEKPNLRFFMKKCNFEDDNMIKSELEIFHNFSIHPTASDTSFNKGFVNVIGGHMGGFHCTFFYKNDHTASMSHAGSTKKPFFFDSFDGAGKFALQQLPKPIIFRN